MVISTATSVRVLWTRNSVSIHLRTTRTVVARAEEHTGSYISLLVRLVSCLSVCLSVCLSCLSFLSVCLVCLSCLCDCTCVSVCSRCVLCSLRSSIYLVCAWCAGIGLEYGGFSTQYGDFSVSHLNDFGYLRIYGDRYQLTSDFILNRDGSVYDRMNVISEFATQALNFNVMCSNGVSMPSAVAMLVSTSLTSKLTVTASQLQVSATMAGMTASSTYPNLFNVTLTVTPASSSVSMAQYQSPQEIVDTVTALVSDPNSQFASDMVAFQCQVVSLTKPTASVLSASRARNAAVVPTNGGNNSGPSILSAGAIFGIILAVIIVVGAIIVVIYYLVLKRNQQDTAYMREI